MREQIIGALQSLDTDNDEHWTANGSPKVEVVAGLIKEPSLKRKAITEAAPLFTRENPVASLEPTPSPGPDEETPDEETPDEETPDEETPDEETPQPDNDEEAELVSQYQSQKEKVEKLKEELEAGQKFLRKEQDYLDHLTDEMSKVFPNSTNQEAISDYLATQQRLREQRVSTMNQFAQMTGTPKSAIDKAFERNTKRGTTRPAQ